jgi:uncharacterized membrane protein
MYDSSSHETSLGLDERWERVLCYALGWITGLIFLFAERKNQVVQRHARQSIIIFGGLSLLLWLVNALGGLSGATIGWVPVIGGLLGFGFGLLGGLIWIVTVVAWIGLMVMAYSSAKTLFVGPRWERIL